MQLKNLFANKLLIINYGLVFVWLIAILVLNHFVSMAPWTLIILFFGLLFIPGFALTRIFRFDFDDKLNQVMFRLSLGLIFILICIGIMMFLGQSIFGLAFFCQIAIAAILITAFILDWRRKPVENKNSCDWREFLNLNNLGYLVIILIAIVVVVGVGIQGSLFRGGDANFHLAIFRKAFEGSSLSPGSLSFIKSNEIHIAYGLPLWHIFLGLITRLANSEVFLVWKTICIPLSIFAILVWYWLAKTIFQNRFFAFVSLALFLNFIFNWNTGYLFTVLPFPDTLNNYIMFPLAVTIFLQYIFGESKLKYGNIKILAILVLFAPLMANIHLTQYVYLLILNGLLGLFWLAFFWRSPDYKKILVRIGLALAACVIFFLPVLAYIEIKSRVITKTVLALWNATQTLKLRYIAFDKLNYFGKWAFMVAPLTIVFLRKNRGVLFLISMFGFLALTFAPWFRNFLMKILGYIFANRIFGSVFWHFLILALVVGLFILLVDWLVSFLPKIWRWTVNGLFVVAALVFVWGELKFGAAAKAFEWLFSNAVDDWFNAHYLWIMVILTVVALGIVFWQWRQPRIEKFFELKDPQNGLMASTLIISLCLVLFGTTYSYGKDYVRMAIARPYVFQKVTEFDYRSNESHYKNVVKSIGGPEVYTFIQENIQDKSVFLVPGGVVDTLPTLLDQYMIEYPKKKMLRKTQEVYKEKNKITIDEAVALFTKEKVEYILLTDAPDQNQKFFDQNPSFFTPVFSKDAAIYKFNKP